MTTYYVATLAAYVLVEAADETEARALARPGLEELRASTTRRAGSDTPVVIHTVRPATDDEIELARFHRRMRDRYG